MPKILAAGKPAATVALAALTVTLCCCLACPLAHARVAPGAKKTVESVVPWSAEVSCSVCHEDETRQAQTEVDAKTVDVHASLDCVQCHDQKEELDSLHANVTNETRSPTRLKKTDVGAVVCLRCHGDNPSPITNAEAVDNPDGQTGAKTPGNNAALIEATEHSRALTDANGTTVNPHDLPAVEAHEAFQCSDCHSVHNPDANPSDKAASFCQTCHHANIYECFTCHEHA